MECDDLRNDGVELVMHVGSGSYGDVYMAKSTETDEIVAVKRPRKGEKVSPIEFATQSYLSSPYIMPLLGLRGTSSIEVIMPFTPTSLQQIIRDKHIMFNERVSIARKILEGIACMHANGILHIDIKPDNIQTRPVTYDFVTVNEPYIIDFGLALNTVSCKTGHSTRIIRGSLSYLPPEIISVKGVRSYTDKVDIWAYGMTILQLLTKQKFFPNTTTREQLYPYIINAAKGGTLNAYIRGLILNQNGTFVPPSSLDMTVDLISFALTLDPANRPTAKDLLQHALFSRVSTPIEVCNHTTIQWPPATEHTHEQLILIHHGAKLIYEFISEFRMIDERDEVVDLLGVSLRLLYWALDMYYMYISLPDIDLNMESTEFVGYCAATIVIVMRMLSYAFAKPRLATLVKIGQKHVTTGSSLTTEIIEACTIKIMVGLNGRIWRRHIFESLRKMSDVKESIPILFTPSRYFQYIPNPIDPLNDIWPVAIQRLTMRSVTSGK